MIRINNFYYRCKNAFKIGYWAFTNPQCLQEGTFKMLSALLELILKVATDNRPFMSRIGHIHPDTKEFHSIVTLWAGCGLTADPYDRIEELQKEISILKQIIFDHDHQDPRKDKA